MVDQGDIARALRADEPNYAAIAGWVADAGADTLEQLVDSADVHLSARVAALAGYLDEDNAKRVLARATVHESRYVRVAAVSVLPGPLAPEDAAALTSSALLDPDAGVRKWALLAAEKGRLHGVRQQVGERLSNEPVEDLRELARRVSSLLEG